MLKKYIFILTKINSKRLYYLDIAASSGIGEFKVEAIDVPLDWCGMSAKDGLIALALQLVQASL